MSGYTPLFDSLTTGTLCGRWPDIGLWPIVMSLSDRNGVVDVTPDFLARVTGLPLDEVIACMKRFCQPDPYSRTQTADGARLELLDSHRNWGWRVINKAKYREKARLMNRDAERTASGEDAERKRSARARNSEVPLCPPCPPTSPENPLSDSESYTDTDTCKTRASATETEAGIHLQVCRIKAAYPKAARPDWITGEKNARNAVLRGDATWDDLYAGTVRYAAHCQATRRMVMNPAKFFGDVDRPWIHDWAIPPKLSGLALAPNNDAAWAEAKHLAAEIGFRPPDPMETVSSYTRQVKEFKDRPAPTAIVERIGLRGIKRIGAAKSTPGEPA